MSGVLAEAFKKEAMRRKDEELWQKIGECVKRGMWPFETGNVTLELEQDHRLYDWGRTLWVTIDALRDYPFKFKFDEKALVQAYFPDIYLLEAIGQPIFEHFRYRPSLPVDDHIILGED